MSGFQCFGPTVTEIKFDDLTFLIGPNGSGKTAVLQALCRLFAFDPVLRRVQRSDFHVPLTEPSEPKHIERTFWLEAEFAFPELADGGGEHPAIPPNFAHMRLDSPEGTPIVRFRLESHLSADDEIEDTLYYVLSVDDQGVPTVKHQVPRADRNDLQVHYLPARRDPSDHIVYTAKSLIGRALRAVNWEQQREAITELTERISSSLTANLGVESFSQAVADSWHELHKGSFFSDPHITFIENDVEALLRHMSVSFTPGHGEPLVDFSRLSDGHKSVLYLSLVLGLQRIGRAVLAGDNDSFDPEKLRPAIYTLVAMEEPENSLSPHYLGRVVRSLATLGTQEDAQALIATHAPSMLRRMAPECIRYLRLDSSRQSKVTSILMPPSTEEAYKFVREAVQAFPELYFARLVVLGEGDSEEIVLSRVLRAERVGLDEAAISVVPLGGRHVNHMWRLLSALDIPFITLLDLDLARYHGGWGRVRNAAKNLMAFSPTTCEITQEEMDDLPAWNEAGNGKALLQCEATEGWLAFLETKDVFFSSPLDLDFTMLKSFRGAYLTPEADDVEPTEEGIRAVLGDNYHGSGQYQLSEQRLFGAYRKNFKTASKPVAHLSALASLTDEQIKAGMPVVLARLVKAIVSKLDGLPE